MTLLFLCLIFLFTIFIGIPLVWAIFISTLVPMWAFGRTEPLESIFLNYIAGIEPNHYTAIPLFIVAGELISRGGVGSRIVHFSRTLLGFLPGGLGMCTVASSMIFGGISGSAIADTAAIGSVMVPAMAKQGYPKPFAAALVAAAGTIGIIVPPSIPMLIGLAMMGVCAWVGKSTGCDVGGERSTLAELWWAFVGCLPALLMPMIILGGIFSGIFTPTESAAVAAVYGFLVVIVIYRDFSIRDLPRLIVDSFVISAIVMVVIGATQVLAWLITVEQMPAILIDWMKHFSTSPWMFLLLVNIALLILGHFLEPVPAILLTAPLFIPTAKAFGIDPVHLGLIMSCNLALGLFTPPIGATLFVASKIANVGVLEITRSMGWLFLVSLMTLILITYVDVLPMGLVWLYR